MLLESLMKSRAVLDNEQFKHDFEVSRQRIKSMKYFQDCQPSPNRMSHRTIVKLKDNHETPGGSIKISWNKVQPRRNESKMSTMRIVTRDPTRRVRPASAITKTRAKRLGRNSSKRRHARPVSATRDRQYSNSRLLSRSRWFELFAADVPVPVISKPVNQASKRNGWNNDNCKDEMWTVCLMECLAQVKVLLLISKSRQSLFFL